MLRASAVDLGAPGHDIVYGDGRVDAAAALVEPVPDPIPNLDPPAPLPPLSLVVPRADVARSSQTATDLHRPARDHRDVVDSIALLGSWPQINGHCQNDGKVHVQGPHVRHDDRAQEPAARHAATRSTWPPIDDDFNYDEALSPLIKILDLVAADGRASHARRRATAHVGRSANVEVRFSEPVVLKGTPVVLRNAHTGKAVAGDDLVGRAYARARASTRSTGSRRTPATASRSASAVVDRGGNHLVPVHWGFVTGS